MKKNWFLVFGSWFLVFGSWFLVLGFWFLVLGSWFLVLGSWFLVPGSWFLVFGSWFLVLGSWFLVLGSWFRKPGTRNPEPGTRNPEPHPSSKIPPQLFKTEHSPPDFGHQSNILTNSPRQTIHFQRFIHITPGTPVAHMAVPIELSVCWVADRTQTLTCFFSRGTLHAVN